MKNQTTKFYSEIHLLKDIIRFPYFGYGVGSVWNRNYRFFLYTWTVSLFWVLFEPLFYLAAIGFGVGTLVDTVSGISYLSFYFPALLANTAMFVPFFENTYGTYTKLAEQKTFSTTIMTPIGPDEVVLGELIWGASKGLFGIIGVIIVALPFGLITNLMVFPAIVILALICWVFAAFALLITSYATNYNSFIYATSGVVVPLSLFSGTYFPLAQLPKWLQFVSYCFPLTHGVEAIRQLLLHGWSNYIVLNIFILVLYGIILTNWSVARINRKLID